MALYEPVGRMSRDDAERTSGSAEPKMVSRAVIAVAVHDNDLEWAEACCERFSPHSDRGVRGSTLLGFGTSPGEP